MNLNKIFVRYVKSPLNWRSKLSNLLLSARFEINSTRDKMYIAYFIFGCKRAENSSLPMFCVRELVLFRLGANHISFNQFIWAHASCSGLLFVVHNQLHCTLWCIDARIANKSYQESSGSNGSLGSKFSFSVHLSFRCSHRRSTKTCSRGQNKRLEAEKNTWRLHSSSFVCRQQCHNSTNITWDCIGKMERSVRVINLAFVRWKTVIFLYPNF